LETIHLTQEASAPYTPIFDQASTMAAPIFFETAEAFRRWLHAHAHQTSALLVGFHKVSTGRPSMSWSDSVNEALCFGWIDGVRKRMDDHTYSIRFTPRKPASIWSAVNIAKVAQLRAQGKMTPAGEAAFSLRKAHRSGVYAYEQEGTAELSPEEMREFQHNTTAWAFFEATPPSYKKRMLHRITTAKRTDTRASRLARLMLACQSGERLP
jgi:uncharacterized protein YdeI (YjbR/CyaY-like superfamily)